MVCSVAFQGLFVTRHLGFVNRYETGSRISPKLGQRRRSRAGTTAARLASGREVARVDAGAGERLEAR
jgi:hypothetical protein